MKQLHLQLIPLSNERNLTPYSAAPSRDPTSRTTLPSSGGSIDLKINNSLSLDKECEMKAVETEVQIIEQHGYQVTPR